MHRISSPEKPGFVSFVACRLLPHLIGMLIKLEDEKQLKALIAQE